MKWSSMLPLLLLLGCSTFPGTGERVVFDSLDADLTHGKATPVAAILYRPAGPGPFPAVVAMHGCGGLFQYGGRNHGKVVERNQDWALRLSAAGYLVLMPDSFGPRGLRESCTVKEQTVAPGRERPRDAYGALRWLQQQPYVKPDAIALMGWSHGGGTVLNAVATQQPARPASLPDGDFRAAIAFYPGCPHPTDSARGRGWRTRIPLLILGGEADDWTPDAPCKPLAAAARARGESVTHISYPGAHHGFDSPNTPVHVRTGLARAPEGRAHVGTDPTARADALVRVPAFLGQHLAAGREKPREK